MADNYFAGRMTFKFGLDGEIQLNARLEGDMRAADDLTPALEKIADRFQRHMEEVFETQGAANESGEWAPLSPLYRRWKDQHFGGRPILTREGDLRSAMSGHGAGAIRRIGKKSLEVGGSVRTPDGRYDLGRIHQDGTNDLSVPPRPIIDLPKREKDAYLRFIRNHLYDKKL